MFILITDFVKSINNNSIPLENYFGCFINILNLFKFCNKLNLSNVFNFLYSCKLFEKPKIKQ